MKRKLLKKNKKLSHTLSKPEFIRQSEFNELIARFNRLEQKVKAKLKV